MLTLSLRARALLGGIVWIVVAIGLSGFVLLTAFDQIAERGFSRRLSGQLDQMAALVYSGAFEGGRVPAVLRDPNFGGREPGRYWQIEGPDGRRWASPSLGDTALPGGPPGSGEGEAVYVAAGPDRLMLQVHSRGTLGPEGRRWRVWAAEARAALSRDKLEFRRSLFGALIGLGASLVLAGAAQTGMALRPLVALRSAFLAYRTGASDRVAGVYPSDIAPLVDDLNEVLDRNAELLRRARRQAADLAHAIKTPAAILRNETDELEQVADTAEEFTRVERMREALDRIDALMDRHTARARLAGAPQGAVTELRPVIEGLGRVMGHVHRDRDRAFYVEAPDDLRVRAESEDVEEMLGNLIDNAFKWAEHRVAVLAAPDGPWAEIRVEDDGPGIPQQERETVLEAGIRLDETTPGTGLGLAIAVDIVDAYGGALTLGESRLGGLRATVRLPRAQRGPLDPAEAAD